MASAQAGETSLKVGVIEGTLLVPDGADRPPAALLIAGSGQTDRDGNGRSIKPATLKKLAEQLALRGIASLRYDKRSSRGWHADFGRVEDFRFPHFADDAAAFATHLRNTGQFSRLVLVGHSEGALVGCLAAQRVSVDALALLSATSRRQADLVKEQLQAKLPQSDYGRFEAAIDGILAAQPVEALPPIIPPPALQPGLASALKEDPIAALQRVTVPVFIAAGTRDSQVRRLDFDQLAAAAPTARTLWLEKMNHLLVDVTDDADNIAAYNQPERALNGDLVDALATFIRAN